MSTVITPVALRLPRPALRLLTLAMALSLAAFSGCAKNVDKFDYNKWGNSFMPQKGSAPAIDTTTQGGAAQNNVIPQNGINRIPKAALGGAYQRGFSTSTNYRLVGGINVNGGN